MSDRARTTSRWRAVTSTTMMVGVAASVMLPAVGPDVAIAAQVDRIVVDSTGDGGDGAPGDGLCAALDGTCTLRAALQEANARPGHDVVAFDIAGVGPRRIDVATTLPVIDDPAGVTIHGDSQPGSTRNTLDHGTNARIMIELRGTGPDGIDGFDIRSSNNEIRGLAMFDFRRHVRVFGPDAAYNEIVGNFLGTDATATFVQPERVIDANSVHVERGAHHNRIGRPGNQYRNLIGGNGDKGVGLFNTGTDFNLVQNNLIGLSPDGSSRLANWGHGIDVNFNASNNLVGGSTFEEGNVVSGNELSGIEISHNVGTGITTGNVVSHNLVGTTPDGTAAPLYAANREFGVNLEGRPRCAERCPPDIEGNTVERNVIVGSNAGVMIWKGAHDNRVAFNNIGVLADGSPAESSAATTWAILIEAGAFDNLIERNLIAEVARGIHLKPDNDFPAECYTFEQTCPDRGIFAVYGNTFSMNSIDDIDQGLGIDLLQQSLSGGYVAGPSITAGADVQGGVQTPVISSVTTDGLEATTCAGCSIEVFSTPAPTCVSCWSEYGRGRSWIAEGVADAAGRVRLVWRTSVDDRYVAAPGSSVSIHTTDEAGNTSEFSLRRRVDRGAVAAPADTSIVEIPVGVGPLAPGPSRDLLRIVGMGAVERRAERCGTTTLC